MKQLEKLEFNKKLIELEKEKRELQVKEVNKLAQEMDQELEEIANKLGIVGKENFKKALALHIFVLIDSDAKFLATQNEVTGSKEALELITEIQEIDYEVKHMHL